MVYVADIGWLDANSERSYPLLDGVTALDTTGTFTIPTGLLVDMRLAAPDSYDNTQFYISQLATYGTGVVITIAVNGIGPVASVTVLLTGFTGFATYTVTPLPGYAVGGTVVIGTVDALVAAAAGVYNFVLAATQILPTVIFPAVPSVTSISIVDAFGATIPLTGAVVLAAGTNASLSVASQTITFAMDSGVVLNDPCGSDPGGTRRSPILSIAGVTPDESGNIDLVGTSCLAITPNTAVIQFNDTCAQPCCSSTQLDALTASVNSLNQQLSTVAGNVATVEAALRIVTTYIGQ